MSTHQWSTGAPRRHHGGDVVWAWGLIGVTVPAGVAALLVVKVVADALGMTVGLPQTGGERVAQVLFDVGLYLAVAAPLVGSVALGLRAWHEEHEGLGLRAAVVSAGLLVVGTALVLLAS
ncbi:MAG TPA: hypothetical protein VFZ64_00270 [Nocardioidaceae bacterium]